MAASGASGKAGTGPAEPAEPEPELEPPPLSWPADEPCTGPDPSSWLHDGNRQSFGILHSIETDLLRVSAAEHRQQDGAAAGAADDVGADYSGTVVRQLCEAFAEKLQTDGWEMNDEDRAEVDDSVQHYLILRRLRRPPFWDARPLPLLESRPACDSGSGPHSSLHVLVISLDQRDDRRRFIDTHMSDHDIAYEYVEPLACIAAVDSKRQSLQLTMIACCGDTCAALRCSRNVSEIVFVRAGIFLQRTVPH